MFHPVKHLSQEILDQMLKEDIRETCHDCGARVGEEHLENCDVARCNTCGGQRLGCGCDEENHDTWTGYWPGVEYCHKNKLVVYDTASQTIRFDLNTAAVMRMKEARA
jgi:hypothetical protein